MADVTKAPVLDTLTRNPDGSLRFTWTNHATTSGYYTSIQVLVRVVGGGVFTGVNTLGYPAISNRYYNQYTKPGGGAFLPNVGYELQLRAYGPLGWSAPSNIRAVPAMVTQAPTLTSATRTSATSASVVFAANPNAPATVSETRFYTRPVGASAWTYAATSTASSGAYAVPLTSGALAFEIVARSNGPAGWSVYSQTRTAEAWWQAPVAPSIVGAERNAATGAATVTFEATPTARGPWVSVEIWRSYGAEQFVRVATLAGSARSWTGAADPTRAVRLRVIAKSHAGDSQATTSSLAATMLVPTAPSGVSASYVATDRAAVTWTRTATEARPYTTQQRVGYRSVGTDAWTWTPVASTATSATITLPANAKVEITVDAGNTAGRSEVATPYGPLVTTPAGPASLSAEWDGADIVVTIPAYSTVGDKLVIESTTDGSTWWPAAEVAVGAGTWRELTPSPGLPHTYRAHVVSDVAGSPVSATVTSPTVPAQTKPAPPTVLPPTVLDATAAIPVSIVHNPLDGSAQTAGEIRHRVGTGAYSTITLGTSPTGTIPAGARTNGQTIGVSARTQGAGGVWSDWSTETLWTLRARPTASLTGPPATVTAQQVTATWTASAQASALVELLHGGLPVESREVGAAARSLTFAHLVADQESYTVRLTVRDAWQAATPATRTFAVELVRPPTAPSLAASFNDPAGSVVAAVTVDAATVLVELWRDGLLVDTAPASGGGVVSLSDRLVPLTGHTYVARAYAAGGGWRASAPAAVDATSRDCRLNFGPHGELQVRGGHLQRTGSGGGREVVMVREVAGGVTAYRSEDVLPLSLSVTVYLHSAANVSTVAEWMDALAYDGPVTYREPLGRTITGAATLDSWVDADRFQGSVSFTITEEAL